MKNSEHLEAAILAKAHVEDETPWREGGRQRTEKERERERENKLQIDPSYSAT
jgi:hypothetical protein